MNQAKPNDLDLRDLRTIGSPPPETPAPPEVDNRGDDYEVQTISARRLRELFQIEQRAEALEASLAQFAAERDAASVPNLNNWTCFHCGETFTTFGGARDHFGITPNAEAGCLIRVKLGDERGLQMELRKAEARADACAETLAQVQQALRMLHDASESFVNLARARGEDLREEATHRVRNALAQSRAVLVAVPGTPKVEDQDHEGSPR